MYKYLLLFFLFCFAETSFAIIPPMNGVKPPANFDQLKQNIEKDYNKGYYAEKTALREMMINKPGFNKITVTADTVFALTLLGRYADSQPIYSPQQFQTKLFDGPSPTGTLTQFYKEISYNQMLMTGLCAGWYSVPGNMESYLEENGLTENGGARFAYELVLAADNNINYANYIQYYDAQNRPHIGFIAVVHTGSDAAAGGHNIWSHRWTFQVYSNAPYITNDIDPVSNQHVIIDGDYAIEPELKGSNNLSGSLIDIGVFAHEFGHIFGLPDLYDTDNSSEGLGNWCLMAGGAYGGNGSNAAYPAHMSVWCKIRLGWLTAVDVTSSVKNVSLQNIEQNPVAYRIWKQNGALSKEYFLVENRVPIGFDKDILGGGLMIYHVDDSRTSNTNENRYWVDLEQADGLRQLNHGAGRGDFGDPFPGSTNNTRFDLSTIPNSNAYTLGKTFVSVRNIKKVDQVITADFDIGTLPFLEVSGIKILETINGNGRVEQGESADISFTLNNIELANSAITKFKFFLDDPGIEVLTPEVVKAVSGQSTLAVTINNAFNVKQPFVSKSLYLKYQVESEGNTIIDSIKIVIGIPKVLVISKGEKASLADYYLTALKSLGFNYEQGDENPAFLSQRDMVIYLTGRSNTNLFTSSEITAITDYYNTGGKVFFSGQNLAEYLKTAYPSFLNEVLGINWVQNSSIFTRYIYGKTGDVIGDQVEKLRINGNDGAQNELNADNISSLGNFNISLNYDTAGTRGAGGWINNNSGGKIFYLGFGFESINNNESTVTRQQFLEIINHHFGVASAVTSNEDYSPVSFSLEQNYPNPFNPSTVIRYSLEKETLVKLEVYDITGSQITVLVNKRQNAGNYNLEFNAADYNLSSGVYLYKLSTGDFTSVKKMLLLK